MSASIERGVQDSLLGLEGRRESCIGQVRSMTDISGRQDIETGNDDGQRRRAGDIWLRSGFDQAVVGLAIVDADVRHILINPAYAQQSGRPKSVLIGSRLTDILTPDSSRLIAAWSEQRHQPTTVEISMVRPDGGTYDASLFLTPIDTREARDHTLVQVIGVDSAPTSRESAARLRAVVEHIDELVLMTRADGALTYTSPAVEVTTGVGTTELLGMQLTELIHPDDHEGFASAARTGRSDSVSVSVRLTTTRGWSRHSCRISEVRDQLGRLLGLAYLARPVASGPPTATIDAPGKPAPTYESDPETSHPSAAGTLAVPHHLSTVTGAQTGAIVADTSDLIWQFDHEGPVYANPAARAMLGLDVDEPLTDIGLGDIHPRWVVERIARHGVPQTLAGVVWEDDLAVLTQTAEEVPVSYVLTGHTDTSGSVGHWSSISRPLDRVLRTEAQIRWAATHDPLTALPGKVLLLDRIEVSLARSSRTGQRVGLLLLDLDFFETINTSVGTDIADRLLVAVAERLRDSVRPGDTVGRMGDDEFVVLCEHFDHLDDAESFAERLLRVVEDPIRIDDADWFVSMSVGIAIARQSVTTADGLLRNANSAMYRAKELGRGRHVVFGNTISSPQLPFTSGQELPESLARHYDDTDS